MLIQQTRVRSLKGRLDSLKIGTDIVVGVRATPDMKPSLVQIGFPENPQIGDMVLPTAIGPRTRFNAEGEDVVHKDRPKETAYQQIEWQWTEFHGDDRVEKSDFAYRPYERYPRTRIPPPSLELKMAVDTGGQRAIVSPPMKFAGVDDPLLIHAVNLFLEIFGFCEVFSEDLAKIIQAPVRRLNWKILPEGRRPWNELRPLVREVVNRAAAGSQALIEHRFEVINDYGPEFVAVGQAGFAGYVVFGFPDRNLFVFESIYTGNATYVFDRQWEPLSRLTKTEILDNNLQTHRFLHVQGWETKVRQLLRIAQS